MDENYPNLVNIRLNIFKAECLNFNFLPNTRTRICAVVCVHLKYSLCLKRGQFVIPTGLYSDRSIFRQVVIPTGRYCDRSLFRQVAIPTGLYSDRSIFRQVAIPTGL